MIPVVLLCGFLLTVPLAGYSDEPQEVTVKPGEDVPLQCPTGGTIALIEWTTTGLKEDHYVFFYRDNAANEEYQDPSYRGRVELRDPQLKDGDASVILKNVRISDAGTYECRVQVRGRDEAQIFSIRVKVEGGQTGGRRGQDGRDTFTIFLFVIAVVLFVLSMFSKSNM